MSNEIKENWNAEEERVERKARLKNLNTASGGKKKIRKHVSPTVIVGIIVILVILAAAGIYSMLQNGWKETHTTAAVVNGQKVTAQEANFILGNLFQGMTYTPAFTDEGKKLLASVFPLNGEVKPLRDGLLERFEQEIQDTYGFSELAEKAEMKLNDADRKQISDYFLQIANAAAQKQLTMSDFMKQLFGPGASEKTIRPVLEKAYLASLYQTDKQNSFEVTEEEVNKEYEENRDNYDSVNFYSFNFNTATLEAEAGEEEKEESETSEASESAGDEKADEETEAEETADAAEAEEEAPDPAKQAEELKAKAEEMMKNVTDEKSFIEEALKYAGKDEQIQIKENNALFVRNALKQELGSNFGEWLFDPARKEGDKTVIENNGTFSVMYFISREKDESPTFDSRHILIRVDTTKEDLKAAQDEAKAKAEEVLKKYQDGEQSEDAFAQLAAEYSDDGGSKSNGGLYENTGQGRFVKEYEDWCMDPARKEGDVELVYVESSNYSGYHIIYFVGLDEAVWKTSAEQVVRAGKFAEYLEEERKNFSYEADENGLKLVLPADETVLESARESLKQAVEQASETPESQDGENNEPSDGAGSEEETSKQEG